MTLVIAVLLLAALLPYLFILVSGLPARGAFSRWGPGYDNDDPRASLEKLDGWRRRAHFAQQNGHEAFAPFAVGVLLAFWAHAPSVWLGGLAFAFLAFRLAHGAAYIAGSGRWRSTAWWCGFGCVIGLYGAALAASL